MLPLMTKENYKKLDDQDRVYSWYVRMHGMPWVGETHRNTITVDILLF